MQYSKSKTFVETIKTTFHKGNKSLQLEVSKDRMKILFGPGRTLVRVR